MKNLVRLLVVLFALLVLVTTAVMSESPSGRTFDTRGIVTDLMAVLVLGAVLVEWIRERSRAA